MNSEQQGLKIISSFSFVLLVSIYFPCKRTQVMLLNDDKAHGEKTQPATATAATPGEAPDT